MIQAERLRGTLVARGLSQAQLAKRVGVSQQTIAKLVTSKALNSRYLHQIARELRTTAAYLTGETEDPSVDAIEGLFTGEEIEWIDLLRSIAPADRSAILQLARTLATSAAVPSVNTPKPAFRGADK